MLVMKMANGDDRGGGDDGYGRRSDGCAGDDCHCDSSVGGLGDELSIATYQKCKTSHPFIVSLKVSFIYRTYMLLLVILKRQTFTEYMK